MNKIRELRAFGLVLIDKRLEPFDILRVNAHKVLFVLRADGRRQIRADIEKRVLNSSQHAIQFRIAQLRSSHANRAVALVHRAIRFDALREFLDAFAAVQTRFARVARSGVNLHGVILDMDGLVTQVWGVQNVVNAVRSDGDEPRPYI
jgi:hypothetical protein